MTVTRALAVCALVVLAGCNGALGPFSGTGDGRPPLPPGVTEDGVNATRLLDAHETALDAQSFTVETHATIGSGETNQHARVGANDTAALRSTSAATTVVVDGRRYERIEGPRVEHTVTDWSGEAGSVHEAYVAPTALRSALGPRGRVTGALVLNGTVERDSRTLWRLSVEPRGVTDGDAPSGTVLVTPAGRIVTAERTFVAGDTRVSVSTTFSAVGNTTVTTPDWVDDARRHGDHRGFGAEERRVTARIPAGFSGDSRGLVTLVGVPERTDNGDVRVVPVGVADDPLSDAVVAWYASVDATATHDHAYLTFQYNESRLPANGSASELDVYRLTRQDEQFVALDATINTEENEASVRVDDASGLYVVFHSPTFERIRDRLQG